LEPTQENLHFLYSFVRVLIESGGYRLTSQDQRDLYEQIENVYAVDPDQQGARLWETRVGQGGSMGGVQWGSATDGTNIYVANSDIGRIMLNYSNSTDADPKQGGGMFALRLSDGERVWYQPPAVCARPRCSPAQSAAVSAIPGVAFSGSVDGHMRAYATADGKILWDVDTIDVYEGVNGVLGRGGSAVLAPDGSYLAGPLYGEESILYADLEPQRLDEERQRFDPAGHYHRPDVLTLTVTPRA